MPRLPPEEQTERYMHEVVELTRDCELGKQGERAVVVQLLAEDSLAPIYAGPARYMTLLFVNRPRSKRIVSTGADYLYLRTVEE